MNIVGLKGRRFLMGTRLVLSKVRSLFAIVILCFAGLLSSCDSDDIGDNYYTFTGEMMGKYLQARPDKYSEFTRLLDTTGVIGLLNAYGQYTCFAPNNEAMKNLYTSKGKKGLSDFTVDSLKKVAYDHIISGQAVPSTQFGQGGSFLHVETMSGRSVKIDYTANDQGMVIIVNEESKLQTYDNEVENGYVHELDKALEPNDYSLVEAINENKDFTVFYAALIATGLDNEISKIKDETYTVSDDLRKLDGERDNGGPGVANNALKRVPLERKFGFTVLMESNATLAANGINNMDDLKAYAKQVYDQVYPKDANITDITNRKNSFNRFVAYHLINKKISKSRFIYDFDNTDPLGIESHSIKTYDMFEYIEPMCPNTLIEVRTNRFTSEWNLFNMMSGVGKTIRLTGNTDNDAINGVYHEIDGMLVYSKEWEQELSGKKIRMDAASFFPEFTTNNIRVGSKFRGTISAPPQYESERWFIPHHFLDRLQASENTEFCYYNADSRFMDYQGDELFLRGMYDFSMITPVIPAGTYEVRFGYQPTGARGVAQLYWDYQPCGIPLDLRLLATDAKIGYQTPNLTNMEDPYGYENDKMMRNRGYMKGPADYTAVKQRSEGGYYTGANARMCDAVVRRILGIYTFDEAGTHVFSVKAALAGQFMFDYLEFVPVELLESEGIN